MNDLKGIVLGLLENQQLSNPEFVETNKAALTRILPSSDESTRGQTKDLMVRPKQAPYYEDEVLTQDYQLEASDMVNTDENLSLNAKEEEMIKKLCSKIMVEENALLMNLVFRNALCTEK